MKQEIKNLFNVIDELSNSLAVMKADPQRNINLLKKLKVCANTIKDEYELEEKELEEFAKKLTNFENKEREAKLFKEEEMRQDMQAEIITPTPWVVVEEVKFTAEDMKQELLSDYAMDMEWEYELDDDMADDEIWNE